jgi:predicted RND superfamily exporter protein
VARFRLNPRGPVAVVACCVLLAIPAALQVGRLELRTDFADLLPEGQPSVRGLSELMRRVGSISSLYVAIEGDPTRAGEFAEALAGAARMRLRDEVTWVDYTTKPVQQFYEKHALLYLSLDELADIDEAVSRIHRRRNPLFAGIDADREADAALEGRLRRIREHRRASRFPHGTYTSSDGTLTVAVLRPTASSTGVEASRRLLAKTRALCDELDPKARGLRVSLAGTTATSVEEFDTLRRDIFGTAALCAALVGLTIWLFLRRARMVLLLGLPLAFGALYAFAAARSVIGYVNAQTAFLGVLIVGTGVNYGVVLCARYLEELGTGVTAQAALATATRVTYRPTLTAAAATALSFAALGTAQIRSFSQFGFIGSMGIIFCWVLSYTLLPALLVLAERVAPISRTKTGGWRQSWSYPRFIVHFSLSRPRLLVAVTAVSVLGSIAAVVHFLPEALEYDLRRLRNRSSETSATSQLGKRIGQVLGQSLTPAVVATRDRDQARRVCEALNARARRDGPRAPLKECASIWSLLPEMQEEKLARIAELQRKISSVPREALGAEVREALAYLEAHLSVQRLSPDDLPEELSRRFLERDGTRGAIVLVYPPAGRDLWVQSNLFAFTNLLREIDLGPSERVSSSGEAVVFADILQAIQRDAPRSTLIAGLLVLLAIATTLGRPRPVLQVSGALFVGVVLMAGIGALLRIKYNLFNYVALPTTFGIGLDYAINIQQRAALETPDRAGIERALRGTGPAVVLASLTTIIGYAVLLLADNRALISFGALAVLGEVTTLAAALLVLPATLLLWPRSRRRAHGTLQPTASQVVNRAAE